MGYWACWLTLAGGFEHGNFPPGRPGAGRHDAETPKDAPAQPAPAHLLRHMRQRAILQGTKVAGVPLLRHRHVRCHVREGQDTLDDTPRPEDPPPVRRQCLLLLQLPPAGHPLHPTGQLQPAG